MHALEANIARYAPEAELIVPPARHDVADGDGPTSPMPRPRVHLSMADRYARAATDVSVPADTRARYAGAAQRERVLASLMKEGVPMSVPNAAGVQATRFKHATRLMIDARLAAPTTLARQRVGRHLRLAR